MVVSLDGFATSPDGTHEWMFEWFGEDTMARNLRALEQAGVHAMGHRRGHTWSQAYVDGANRFVFLLVSRI